MGSSSEPSKVPSTPPQRLLRGKRAVGLQLFKRKLDEIDWFNGNTKHLQMQSAFASAAARRIDPEIAEELIRAKIENHGGRFDERAICRNRDHFYGLEPGNPGCPTTGGGRVVIDPELVNRVVEAFGEGDAAEVLRRRSDVDPSGAGLDIILSTLYEEGENVLIFEKVKSTDYYLYKVGTPIPDDLPLKAEGGIFFLTNPVDGLWHLNPREGRESNRSEESITSFRYLLIESDEVPAEEWLKILVQLPVPIAAVYSSGGKSIHSLVRVESESKADFDEGRRRIVGFLQALGVDKNATNAVRLSRLPTAYRGESEQKLLYLKRNPQSEPIQKIQIIR